MTDEARAWRLVTITWAAAMVGNVAAIAVNVAAGRWWIAGVNFALLNAVSAGRWFAVRARAAMRAEVAALHPSNGFLAGAAPVMVHEDDVEPLVMLRHVGELFTSMAASVAMTVREVADQTGMDADAIVAVTNLPPTVVRDALGEA